MSQQQKQTMIFGLASIFAVSCQTSPALLATAWMLGKNGEEAALGLEAR